MASTPKYAESSKKKLGTFAGVFTPGILTILGINLFLRVGYVVGAGQKGNRRIHKERPPIGARGNSALSWSIIA
jgi:hypothetical protein